MRVSRAILVVLVSALVLGYKLEARTQTPPAPAPSAESNSPLLVRFYYDDIRELDQLQSYDLWEHNDLLEKYVLGSTDYAGYLSLKARGWRVEVDSIAAAKHLTRAPRFNNLLDGYRTVEELYSDLVDLNASYPSLSQLVDYGASSCLSSGGCTTPGGDQLDGFPLRAIRVTNEQIPGSSAISDTTIVRGEKPVFFLMANVHAREISTPELAMRLLETLLSGHGYSADITWLVDHHEIWIVPMVNPDGHWLVELGESAGYGGTPFFQRKNANNDADDNGEPDCPMWPPTLFSQYGIDLNRNHSFAWGPPGSSGLACDQTYRGPVPASEPEVSQLEALIRMLIMDQRGSALDDPAPPDTKGLLITLHSFGNQILWPWGQTTNPAPNWMGLKAIGDKLASFSGYTSCQPSLCLYATNGAGDDWAYGELGIPAFTFEIGETFMPPFSEIGSQHWPDIGPALVYAGKIARAPYSLVHGPDLFDLEVTPIAGNPLQVNLQGVSSDYANGGNPIKTVVFSIDQPVWEDGAALLPLTPADGAFDSAIEPFGGIISLEGLTGGSHMLFAQAQDDAGNWGAVSATFLQVDWEPTSFSFLPGVAGSAPVSH